MIYLLVAFVVIVVIIEHVKDVKNVKKTEQKNKELVKQLEKELKELKNKRPDVDKRFHESYDKYIKHCESSLFPEMEYDTGELFDVYKLAERDFNKLHNKISTIVSKIDDIKGTVTFDY